MQSTRDDHPEQWIENQLPRSAPPEPDWPQWAVDLQDRYGNWIGDHEEIAAPTPEAAAEWVDAKLAGSGRQASYSVRPALLHPDHHRWAATDNVRAQWIAEGRLIPGPAFSWLWLPLAWRGTRVLVKVGVYHRSDEVVRWQVAGEVVTARHRTPVKHQERVAKEIAADPGFDTTVRVAWEIRCDTP